MYDTSIQEYDDDDYNLYALKWSVSSFLKVRRPTALRSGATHQTYLVKNSTTNDTSIRTAVNASL